MSIFIIGLLTVYFFFKIVYLLASTDPALAASQTLGIRLHASLIERISFPEAIDVELHLHLLGILDWEVVPLHVAVSVGIKSHIQVILLVWNPRIYQQVPIRRARGYLIQIYCWIRAQTFCLCFFIDRFCFIDHLRLWVTWNICQSFSDLGLCKWAFLFDCC